MKNSNTPDGPSEGDTKTSLGFWDTNGPPNLGQTTSQQQQKKTRRIIEFTVPTDHRVKLKGNEKSDKYLDLARKLKKSYRTWRRCYQL